MTDFMANFIKASRTAVVEQARENWKKKLFDLGRRNNLLYFRDLKNGSLRLPASTELLVSLMDGQTIDLSRWAANNQSAASWNNIQHIRDQAKTNLEEKGIRTCYIVLGLASWNAVFDGGRPPLAPVWLMPVDIISEGREGRRASIKPVGQRIVNPILLHVLKEDFGAVLPNEAEDDGPVPHDWRKHLLEMGERFRATVPEFEIEPTVVLGNFSFQKLAMVADLDELGDLLVENDIVAALAGDADAQRDAFGGSDTQPVDMLDHRLPHTDFSVLDADSSQMQVIHHVISGKSGVILGPPGTGKSQTIVNILAECAALGKSVLFVAEKQAALDVVWARLQEVGLGHLALNLQSIDQSKSAVAKQLGESLDRIRRVPPSDGYQSDGYFTTRRDQLNAYVGSIHQPQPPLELSVYDLMANVSKTPGSLKFSLRLPESALARWNMETASGAEEILKELGALSGRTSPWFAFKLATPTDVENAMEAVRGLMQEWPRFLDLLERWPSAVGIEITKDLRSLDQLMNLWQGMSEISASFDLSVYHEDLSALQTVLDAVHGKMSAIFHHLTDKPYRTAIRTLQSYARDKGKAITARQLMKTLVDHRDQWHDWDLTVQMPPAQFAEAWEMWNMVKQKFEVLSQFEGSVWSISVTSWLERLVILNDDSTTPFQVQRATALSNQLQMLSLGPFLEELDRRQVSPDDWLEAFHDFLYRSVLDRIFARNPALAGFSYQHHERMIKEFAQSDRDHIVRNRVRVARRHAQRVIDVLNAHPEQETLVRQEAAKKSRHLSLRKFLQEAPDALLALRPCWMASPLNVSQLLAARTVFDVVILDEASQVLPEDAIPALARGRQAVVAGDNRQLPPTSFFVSSLDASDEEDAAPYEGFESVLDLMGGLVAPWLLQWHYRSRDERLIAFSNRFIYGNSLVTFPGRGKETPISHVLVPQVMGHDEDKDSVADEAQTVAELVVTHAKENPDQSLGVITMGLKHCERIQMALESLLMRHPDVRDYFEDAQGEHLFIKNLERVQGDERDVVILSVGYGKDRDGKLPYRFGPLLHEGGERRLNVAVTRARHRMIVVSSFNHLDMDPERKTSPGVRLLRDFLAYAASGGDNLLQDHAYDDIPLNPFELAVRDALEQRGLQLIPQWGVSRYRLDFAVKHPERPGEFVLAIECDGASYHSAPTARDRDRLRQQQLEAIGWRFHRIWSTEWFRNPAAEAARAVKAYEEALQAEPKEGMVDRDRIATKGGTVEDSNRGEPITRALMPSISTGVPIHNRSRQELLDVLQWIHSDGLLRTDEELLQEMMTALGFKRRGPRIDETLRQIIAAHPQK